MKMSRRPGNPSRRHGGGSFPYISVALIVMGGILFLFYLRSGMGGFVGNLQHLGKDGGDYPCTAEVKVAISFLKKAYGSAVNNVLHVGPDTCSVVYTLLKQDTEHEAWGIEPYDVEDADDLCKAFVRKGIVRVSDIKFSLPYKAKSFSLVIVSDALDYLSPKYLNQTLPDLARISKDGLVIFTGFPNRQKAKSSEMNRIGMTAKLRGSSWWARYFIQTGLQENEVASSKFDEAATKASYKPTCQIFHLKPKK